MTATLNRAKMITTTTGTGTVTLGSAVTGYATFAEAGAVNATQYPYVIEDGNDFEIGVGTYTSAGTTFSRDTVTLSKIGGVAGTSKINLSGSAQIALTARTGDLYQTGGPDVAVADGGTGGSSLTAYAVLCGGTTSTGPVQPIASVGASGQVLKSNGAGALPTFGDAPSSTIGTEDTTTGGTSIDFTGIPSTVNVIILSFYGISRASGTGGPTVQLGDSGGIENTGYVSAGHRVSTTTVSATDDTAGLTFGTSSFFLDTNSITGQVIITRLNTAGTKWAMTGICSVASTKSSWAAASKTLSAQLDRVRLTWDGTGTFDVNGGVNIVYF